MPDETRPADGSIWRQLEREDPATGGTLAGEDVAGGSVVKRPGEDEPETYGGPDNLGERLVVDPALAGTVAGNTTQAGEVVRKEEEPEPRDAAEDLGPEGTIIQEVGGEGRY